MHKFRIKIRSVKNQKYSFKLFKSEDLTSPYFLSESFWKEPIEKELIYSEEDLKKIIEEIKPGYYNLSDLENVGSRLFNFLSDLIDNIEVLTSEEIPKSILLYLDCQGGLARHLYQLPWETLHNRVTFICNKPVGFLMPIRLYVDKKRGIEERISILEETNRPLRVLFMACSPDDYQPVLDFENEESKILAATKNLNFELEVEESGSLDGLEWRLNSYTEGYFDVFHLTGHALLFKKNSNLFQPIFLMEDMKGYRQEVTAQELAALFHGKWPRLIFLSGCHTADSSSVRKGLTYLDSFCEALMKAGATTVLGWAGPVEDQSATETTAKLYEYLAKGYGVAEAIAQARNHIFKFEQKEIKTDLKRQYFWYLLRLFTNQDPLMPLVKPTENRVRSRVYYKPADRVFLDAAEGKKEVCSREDFVGRRRVLQFCLKNLTSSAQESQGLLIHGLGGLGKSSVAARLCERLSHHQRIVMVGEVNEAIFLRKFSELSFPSAKDPVEKENLVKKCALILNNSRLSLLQRLEDVLKTGAPLAKNPVLFVFDDFEQDLQKANQEEKDGQSTAIARVKPKAAEILYSLLKAIKNIDSDSRVIVTSRYTFPLILKKKPW